VTVEGFINEIPFVVSRKKTASKGDLFFQLDGIDMTTQSVKETQILLEEKLGVDPDILLRSVFHGQHGMNDLLEATDAKLKEELALVVPVDLWVSASTVARAKARDAKKRLDELEGMRRLRVDDIESLTNKVNHAKATKESKKDSWQEAQKQLENVHIEIEQNLLNQSLELNSTDIQYQLDTLAKEIEGLTSDLDSKVNEREVELLPFQIKLEEALVTRDAISQTLLKQEMKVATSQVAVDATAKEILKLEKKWSLDLSRGIPTDMSPPGVCPTCLQPLLLQSMGHDHPNMADTMRKEIDLVHETLHTVEDELNDAMMLSAQLSKSLESQEETVKVLRTELSEVMEFWDRVRTDLQGSIQEKRDLQSQCIARLTSFIKQSQLLMKKQAATAAFKMEQQNVQYASDVVEGLESELQAAIDVRNQFESEMEEQETQRRLLLEVADLCGQRGVQAFIFQNVVKSLEVTAQGYLDYLSEGGQRLELSLDAGEKISRLAQVRGSDGDFKDRPLSALSGGQWRRCSLALSFAFAELVARRGKLKSSLLVLDEPLTHLDRSGRTKFGEVVRRMITRSTAGTEPNLSKLQFSTVILILQDLSAEELEDYFDRMDTVVREKGGSYVLLDEPDFPPV
jgi:DNA repair exonuclease SbcCD ATPase subunit